MKFRKQVTASSLLFSKFLRKRCRLQIKKKSLARWLRSSEWRKNWSKRTSTSVRGTFTQELSLCSATLSLTSPKASLKLE